MASAAAGTSASSTSHSQLAGALPDRDLAPSPFRLDEGFSEDARSQAGSDIDRPAPDNSAAISTHLLAARQWLLAQPLDVRIDLTRDLLAALPNRLVSDLVRERLHFDPVTCLPREIVASIFEYLDSRSILIASLVSKAWRAYALDPFLWRRLFLLEGWNPAHIAVRELEGNVRAMLDMLKSSPAVPARYLLDEDSGASRRLRIENGALSLPPHILKYFSSGTADQLSGMMDADGGPMEQTSPVSNMDPRFHSLVSATSTLPQHVYCPLIKPPRLRDMLKEEPRINWQYLCEQRKRLEENWAAFRYRTFRLPHPDHPKEAHSQCVYTIQFSKKHLVSGSRDQTVRVWDLDTQRLKYGPLQGHMGSVLCLQFDERPEHDIIVSGGSDADVVVWRFSTGRLLKRLSKAHSESVLNLRFNNRYLVTCSKDKTIKLWNRRGLACTDPDYPAINVSSSASYPDYIVNMQAMAEYPSSPLPEPLPEFTLLMTFEGHHAAVNAIQIYQNQIVSASGDRKIMLWDIKTGRLVRQFIGHNKGIACVQYDGKRIVSGSSDNTVRIFDGATAAEVAILRGHRNLVRTVQAEFGDIPGDEELLEAEARENNTRALNEMRQHLFYQQTVRGPQQHFVYGAKLPPGGGGNRWSKIVSGSYDETVIIWRKNNEGAWVPARELRQEEAINGVPRADQNGLNIQFNSRQGLDLAREHATTPAQQQQQQQQQQQLQVPMDLTPDGPLDEPRTRYEQQQQYADLQHMTQHLQPELQAEFQRYRLRVLEQAETRMNATRDNFPQGRASNPFQPRLLGPAVDLDGHQQQQQPAQLLTDQGQLLMQQPQQQTQLHQAQQQPQQQSQQQEAVNPAQTWNGMHDQHLNQGPPPELLQFMQQQQQQQQQHQQQIQHQSRHLQHHHHHHPHPHHHHHGHANGNGGEGASRVFKLQFDSRRIVCCSQHSVIVGWDFANGDEDIIEASQFFGEPR